MQTAEIFPRFRPALLFAVALAACDESPHSPAVPRNDDGPLAAPGYELKAVPRARIARPPSDPSSVPTLRAAPAPRRGGKPSPLTNGSFELNGGVGSPQLDGWSSVNLASGEGEFAGGWWTQSGSSSPITGFLVDPPTDGSFAAMSDQFGPGAHILYQDVVVPRGNPWLSFDLYLANLAGSYFTPETLSPDEFPNQQFRVDIMDPAAPVDDVGAGVLRQVYRTEATDPSSVSYHTISVSLKEFAGRTVRIRFAEVDNQFFFQVGLDRVIVGKKARTPKAPRAPKGSARATAIPFAPEGGPLANALSLGDDETTGLLPIGFTFSFFGTDYTSFNLSSNGFVGFEPDMSQGCCSGGVIPSDDGINNIIALAWTDLYPPGGGSIAYETRGSAPNRRLVVNYTAQSWCCEEGGDRVTAQLILYERRNRIEIHTTHQAPGRIYTQGIENADGSGGTFIPGRVAADYGLENDAVRFTTR